MLNTVNYRIKKTRLGVSLDQFKSKNVYKIKRKNYVILTFYVCINSLNMIQPKSNFISFRNISMVWVI